MMILVEFNTALDTIENTEGNGAVPVITGCRSKFWSNGIDLNFVQEKVAWPIWLKSLHHVLDQLLMRIARFSFTYDCLFKWSMLMQVVH